MPEPATSPQVQPPPADAAGSQATRFGATGTAPRPRLTEAERRERAERRRTEQRELDRVRRRVAAIAFLTVILHADLALPIAASFIHDSGRSGDAIGLLVMSGIVGVLSVVGNRLILGSRVLTPWLVLGLLPPAAGVWLIWFAPFTLH